MKELSFPMQNCPQCDAISSFNIYLNKFKCPRCGFEFDEKRGHLSLKLLQIQEPKKIKKNKKR